MPLLDHFHAPLDDERRWEGFHAQWASEIVGHLNEDILGPSFFADAPLHFGQSIVVDAGIEHRRARPYANGTSASGPATAVAYAPPKADLVLATTFPDDIEVRVISKAAGPELVGAIELVSPGNKGREAVRRKFAAKCVSLLARGVGVVVVDIVTGRLANLHNRIVAMLGYEEPFVMDPPVPTYTASYRPVRRRKKDCIEAWATPLAVGDSLPTVPLPLLNAGVVPLDLERTYTAACRRTRTR